MTPKLRNLKAQIKNLRENGVREGLRRPAVRTANGVTYYQPSTSTGEEICRKFKQVVLPQLTMLIQELELIYNMYSGTTHDTEKEAKKQEKELSPVEAIYKALQKASKDVIKFISESLHEAQGDLGENPPGAGVGTQPVGDKLSDIDEPSDPSSKLASLIGSLSQMNGDDLQNRITQVLRQDEINTVNKILDKVPMTKGEFGESKEMSKPPVAFIAGK